MWGLLGTEELKDGIDRTDGAVIVSERTGIESFVGSILAALLSVSSGPTSSGTTGRFVAYNADVYSSHGETSGGVSGRMPAGRGGRSGVGGSGIEAIESGTVDVTSGASAHCDGLGGGGSDRRIVEADIGPERREGCILFAGRGGSCGVKSSA